MPGIRIYTGNRLETLADMLADVVGEPLADPLAAETIVVRSRGMERWLTGRLAERFGVWANCAFAFPNRLAWQVFRAVLDDLPETDRFEPEAMTFGIMKELPTLLPRPEFEALRNFLEGDHDGLKLFQLSARIADAFDQYLVYRPDMVTGWDEGRDEPRASWQAGLFRSLFPGEVRRHKASIRREFLKAAAADGLKDADLPGRVSVFGIPFLPPLHVELLQALGARADVHVFALDPCREYWVDLFSEKSAARFVGRSGKEKIGADDLHVETGNSLLASTGRMGGAFLDRLMDLPDAVGTESFVEPGDDTLLHRIQSDILNLRDRGSDGGPSVIDDSDRSVRVHSCHGPMREVEVLHDQLLDMFDGIEGLEPRDILVMTPDVEAYAPFVSAVFDSRVSPVGIPYSIADRSPRGAGSGVDAFLRVLEMPDGRFEAASVLDLLEEPAVRRRFGLDEADMEPVRTMVEGVRIRWGIDAEDRRSRGLPPFDDNSWRAGLDRLLLGYAMTGGKTDTFKGILPYDQLEGDTTRVLGRFLEFVETLIEGVGGLDARRSADRWASDLGDLVDLLLLHDDEECWERRLIADALEDMRLAAERAGFGGELDIRVVRTWLNARLGHAPMSSGFLTGGVTFSAMVPMRSIPFRVVALIGMNDGAFPRVTRPPGFDLMAAKPVPGDPSRRDEDRYLFLEALLSARDVLYISYVGQDIRDNSPAPPSVLVSELMDAVDRCFKTSDGGSAADQLVTKHRLQAFSKAYFDGSEALFSYSRGDSRAVRAVAAGRVAPGPFVDGPLNVPDGLCEELSPGDLSRFLVNPSRHFLVRRLGIRMSDLDSGLEEREPFELEGLDRYGLGQDLVNWMLEGRDLEDCFAAVRASGVLPPGGPGRAAWDDLVNAADELATRVGVLMGETAPKTVPVRLDLGPSVLGGSVSGVGDGRLVRFRLASVKAKDRLVAWVDHLTLCALGCGDRPSTYVVGPGEVVRFGFVENAIGLLADLASLYREGLEKPLPFFPETSWEYATRAAADPDGAMKKAVSKFHGNDRSWSESDDSWVGVCFRRSEPLAGPFGEIARRVMDPIILAGQGGGE